MSRASFAIGWSASGRGSMIESRACKRALHAAPSVRSKRLSHKTLCWESGPRRRNTSSMRSGVCGATGSCEKYPAMPHMNSGRRAGHRTQGRRLQQPLIELEQLPSHGCKREALSELARGNAHGDSFVAVGQSIKRCCEGVYIQGIADVTCLVLFKDLGGSGLGARHHGQSHGKSFHAGVGKRFVETGHCECICGGVISLRIRLCTHEMDPVFDAEFRGEPSIACLVFVASQHDQMT